MQDEWDIAMAEPTDYGTLNYQAKN
ncbi:hypothetical protein EYZ11_007874 [Aspergillus tanneri]|uniref:Uncharacterized protein n=1 Tax=Aspergillus tanneri TaxID=1220188 RepID=A0A4V6RQS1_9EURO|nr:hypothetical protein EYZ11_007874 [Aspergillus tanneri]